MPRTCVKSSFSDADSQKPLSIVNCTTRDEPRPTTKIGQNFLDSNYGGLYDCHNFRVQCSNWLYVQPVAAQSIIPAGCPPNTQDFNRGVCIGPEPTLTYECDGTPLNLILIGDECVLGDYREPAILVDAECNGPFPFIEETLRCATRPGGQNIAP